MIFLREINIDRSLVCDELSRNALQIQALERDIAEQKLNTLLWRNKCHEILDAVELANMPHPWDNHIQFQPITPQKHKPQAEKRIIQHYAVIERPTHENIPPLSTLPNSARLSTNSENDEYSDRLMLSSSAMQQTPFKSSNPMKSDSYNLTPRKSEDRFEERGRTPHRYSRYNREESESVSPHPVEQSQDVNYESPVEDNSRAEQKECSPKGMPVSTPQRPNSREWSKKKKNSPPSIKGGTQFFHKSVISTKETPRHRSTPVKLIGSGAGESSGQSAHKEDKISRSPHTKHFGKNTETSEIDISSPKAQKRWNPFFSRNDNRHTSPKSPSVYDLALQKTKVRLQPKKPISPIAKEIDPTISIDTLESELPTVPPEDVYSLEQDVISSKEIIKTIPQG